MLNAETPDADMLNADMLSFSRKSAADMPESGRYARFAAVCIRHARLAQIRLVQIRLTQAEREHARFAADKQRETVV